IRFGLQEYGIRGWETDRGLIYVRYGEPLRKATFSPTSTASTDFDAAGRITTVWSYGMRGPVFVFRQNPGYRRATFAGDFRFYTEDYRSIQPTSLSAPSLPERYDLPVQVVRFRGPGGAMDLEVHSLVPLDRLGEKATGLQRETRTDRVAFRGDSADLARLESWRLTLPGTRQYLVGVEAREPLTWHAAIGRVTVDGKEFPAGTLSVSDMLLAHDVEPLTVDAAARSDFRIAPNPAMRYRPDEPVALYFEIYNLLPDSDQFASYEVELVVTVEEIERQGPAIAQIIGEL